MSQAGKVSPWHQAKVRGLPYLAVKIDLRTYEPGGDWVEFKGAVTKEQADRLGELLVEILKEGT